MRMRYIKYLSLYILAIFLTGCEFLEYDEASNYQKEEWLRYNTADAQNYDGHANCRYDRSRGTESQHSLI